MAYSKVSIPTEVFHFTQRQNLEQILADRRIRRFGDTECWFCRSPEDMLRYMEMTVMNEGQKYIAPDRTLKRYPKFEPENYVMLGLSLPNGKINGTNGTRNFPPMLPLKPCSRQRNSLS